MFWRISRLRNVLGNIRNGLIGGIDRDKLPVPAPTPATMLKKLFAAAMLLDFR